MSIINSSSVGGEGTVASIQPIELSLIAPDFPSIGNAIKPTAPRQVLIFFNVLQHFAQQSGFISVDIVRLNPRQRFDYLSTMPRIVDEDGEVLKACMIAQRTLDESGKVIIRPRQISVARAQELHRAHYFLIPEPEENKEAVELHVISDRSRCIRTIDDLLGAIALHFSEAGNDETVISLNEGVTSVRFASNDNRIIFPDEVAGELSTKCDQFIQTAS
jgi:hypothetical protein